MNTRTRTLIAAALVLGIASGPAVAHAASVPAPAGSAAGVSAPLVPSPPNAAALERAIAGLGAEHKDATAALVRVGGTSGSWRGSSGVADIVTGRAVVEQGGSGRGR